MNIQLLENETATYGDLTIRAIRSESGESTFKIQSDKGQLVIRPSAGNTVIIESTANSKQP